MFELKNTCADFALVRLDVTNAVQGFLMTLKGLFEFKDTRAHFAWKRLDVTNAMNSFKVDG